MSGGGAAGWPWSALGIGETADKDAIRAAYEAERTGLDGGGSISASADLTAAREVARNIDLVPQVALAEAAEAPELEIEIVRRAISNVSDPASCTVKIGVLDVVLARSEEVPDAAFASL